MAKKDSIATGNLPELLELLNQILKLEYSLIIHYPRLASAIKDESARKRALQLGSASVHHADTVAKAISKLGGKPYWSFEPFPEESDMLKIFQRQLEKEKLALQLHRQSAYLMMDALLRDKVDQLAKEEESHIQTVEYILSRLTQ